MSDILNGIPSKPVLQKGASPEEQLAFQERSKEYWFALETAQHTLTQESTAQSNLQKAAHDMAMAIANNTK
jgi:hypothetical protein